MRHTKKSAFVSKYKAIRNIVQNIDPGSFGAEGEYDDTIFKIIKNAQGITDLASLSQSIERTIGNEFGLGFDQQIEQENFRNACEKIAGQILVMYPQGV